VRIILTSHPTLKVTNAIEPYTAIYFIWSTGKISSKVLVPFWILAFGGAAVVIGLWTYGYNIMRALGIKITLHSLAPGLSMELGAAITVILATKLALPVSTTQCITGATEGLDYATERGGRSTAHGCLDLHGLHHSSALRWYHLWMFDGHYSQRAKMG
jgi:phosphate/sulfate permease